MSKSYDQSPMRERELRAKEKRIGTTGVRALRRERRRLTETEQELEEFARKARQAIDRGHKLNPW